MIVGDFTDWERDKQAVSPVLRQALEYLRCTDMLHWEPGKYELDGEDMFLVVQELDTVVKTERKAERHARYIDVHYLIRGKEERIGVGRAAAAQVMVEDELESADYALYDTIHGEVEVTLVPGMYAVFFPADVHRPGCSSAGGSAIKKAVIKIHTDLLCQHLEAGITEGEEGQ